MTADWRPDMPYFGKLTMRCMQIEAAFDPERNTVDIQIGNDIRLHIADIDEVYGLMDVLQDAARAMAKFQSEQVA
ncbi:hypothetical protein [Rhodococcus sp. ADH]|uniref:hypothetical protein n=2 Tax=unclassified Rhodococcus (in: high G+C Gram-positive bacteria) TaxID=192944 RepID=UPI0012ED3572|nr:hypothetical protein [Rhodococcus sp. ADH]